MGSPIKTHFLVEIKICYQWKRTRSLLSSWVSEARWPSSRSADRCQSLLQPPFVTKTITAILLCLFCSFGGVDSRRATHAHRYSPLLCRTKVSHRKLRLFWVVRAAHVSVFHFDVFVHKISRVSSNNELQQLWVLPGKWRGEWFGRSNHCSDRIREYRSSMGSTLVRSLRCVSGAY